MAHRAHAVVHPVQRTPPHAVSHPARAESQRRELCVLNDAMLRRRELRNRLIARGFG